MFIIIIKLIVVLIRNIEGICFFFFWIFVRGVMEYIKILSMFLWIMYIGYVVIF